MVPTLQSRMARFGQIQSCAESGARWFRSWMLSASWRLNA